MSASPTFPANGYMTPNEVRALECPEPYTPFDDTPFGLDVVEDWAELVTLAFGSDEWMELVDVERLDLHSMHRCVLGQLGEWRTLHDALDAWGSEVFADNIYLDAWKLVMS